MTGIWFKIYKIFSFIYISRLWISVESFINKSRYCQVDFINFWKILYKFSFYTLFKYSLNYLKFTLFNILFKNLTNT